MNATALLLGLALTQTPDAVGTPPDPASLSDPAPAVEEAQPMAAPVSGRTARRASSMPITSVSTGTVLRRAVAVTTAGAGAGLLVLGLAAAGAVAVIEYARWPESPKPTEYPRHTLSVVAAAVAAVSLMAGAVCVVGGVAAML